MDEQKIEELIQQTSDTLRKQGINPEKITEIIRKNLSEAKSNE